MADIVILKDQWRELTGSANCFIPRIIDAASDPVHGFANVDLHRTATSMALFDFSGHIVGKFMKRKAVKHSKAQDFVKVFNRYNSDNGNVFDPITEADIVAAVLALPDLAKWVGRVGLTEEILAKESSVSLKAINHALSKGRVSAGIAGALHRALSDHDAEMPDLANFATSDPLERIAKKSVAEGVFDLSDLMLPFPANAPEVWR